MVSMVLEGEDDSAPERVAGEVEFVTCSDYQTGYSAHLKAARCGTFALEFALLRNLVIGLIDGGDLLGGDRDELLRQAAHD